jgi:hypothetical protein
VKRWWVAVLVILCLPMARFVEAQEATPSASEPYSYIAGNVTIEPHSTSVDGQVVVESSGPFFKSESGDTLRPFVIRNRGRPQCVQATR